MQPEDLAVETVVVTGRTFSLEEIAALVVDTAFHLYDELGPGLLESVYQTVLASMLEKRGLRVERQKLVTFEFDGVLFEDGLRVDLLVEGCLVVELKSVEAISPVHLKQLLTYIRLLELPLGLLLNFGGPTFKGAVKRVVNNRIGFVSEFEALARSPRTKRASKLCQRLLNQVPFESLAVKRNQNDAAFVTVNVRRTLFASSCLRDFV